MKMDKPRTAVARRPLTELEQHRGFVDRHIGTTDVEQAEMLKVLGYTSRAALIDAAVPPAIRCREPLALAAAKGEQEALDLLQAMARKNRVVKSYIGQGYYGTLTPGVILRNVLENPAWYTAYTPYQPEISQGRLEALVNFQTMVCDLTGMAIANASMLDEATAAAEAMALARRVGKSASTTIYVADDVLPQTLDVVRTRAAPLGLTVMVGPATAATSADCFAALLQYPGVGGDVRDYRAVCDALHARGALVLVAADLLALTLLVPPGEWGADAVVGSSQRFGVPMGFGGPHAAFLATRDEFKRNLPGRLVGVTIDANGQPAYRLALQTREQHIRREKATSNICTAQVLLAVIASMYAAYHGPQGLRAIAERVHRLASQLADGLRTLGLKITHENFFDTIRVEVESSALTLEHAQKADCDLRALGPRAVGISFDETTTLRDLELLMSIFRGTHVRDLADDDMGEPPIRIPQSAIRTSEFLTHPVFNTHDTETEMLRYLQKLESCDLSLTTSMIPLGSCTMKLNATAEMFPISWPEISKLHPFAPMEQTVGYTEMCEQLENWLAAITGFDAISLQPNAGSQGEFAGLLAMR